MGRRERIQGTRHRRDGDSRIVKIRNPNLEIRNKPPKCRNGRNRNAASHLVSFFTIAVVFEFVSTFVFRITSFYFYESKHDGGAALRDR